MNEIVINIIIGIVLGIVTGLVTSTIVNSRGFLDSAARARYRVRETVKATKEILEKPKETRARTRNRYRYSLGVIIDDFDNFWKSDTFKEDEWPRLVHFAYDSDGQPYTVEQLMN